MDGGGGEGGDVGGVRPEWKLTEGRCILPAVEVLTGWAEDDALSRSEIEAVLVDEDGGGIACEEGALPMVYGE